MTKRTKIIVIVAAVIIVAVCLYFYYRPVKPVEDQTNTKADPSKTNTPTTTPKVTPNVVDPTKNTTTNSLTLASDNDEFPLKIGSRGNRVTLLKNALKRIKPSITLTADSIFDEATRLATITYVGTAYYPVTANNYSAIMIKSTN